MSQSTDFNTILTIPKPREVKLKEVSFPKIKPGFLLIRVEIAPVCIEHQIYRDHTFEWFGDETRMGHEGVGTVVETEAGSRFREGDRVIVYQGNPCQECFVCQRGLSPTHCLGIPYEEIVAGSDPNAVLESLGGGEAMAAPGGLLSIERDCDSPSGGFGHATYRIAPEYMVQRIPDGLDFRYAAAANCSAGCTYTPCEEMEVKRGDWVLVAGVGFIGFGVILNAKYRGAKIIVLGRNKTRMEIARKMGADHVIDPEDEDWLDQIHALTGYLQGVDHVFECSGYPFYQERALKAVRRYGAMFLLGFQPGNEAAFPLHLLDVIQNRHVKLTGGHDVQVNHREGLVNMLQEPDVQRNVDHMVTHHLNMSDAAKGFDAALAKTAGKIFLYPQENAPA